MATSLRKGRYVQIIPNATSIVLLQIRNSKEIKLESPYNDPFNFPVICVEIEPIVFAHLLVLKNKKNKINDVINLTTFKQVQELNISIKDNKYYVPINSLWIPSQKNIKLFQKLKRSM